LARRDAKHLANVDLRFATHAQIANLPIALRVAVKDGKIVHGRTSFRAE
jgi:hypothetical protein